MRSERSAITLTIALVGYWALSSFGGSALAQSGPIDPNLAQDASPRPSLELSYTSSLNRQFPIYVFEADQGAGTGSNPALVMFHGGSWRTGEPRQFFRQAEVWNRLGVTVFLPVYALERTHGATPQQSVEDAFRAWQAVHQNAEALGIDSTAIAAGGGSAGGHLAAGLATLTPPAAITGHSPPTGLILFNPVIDNSPQGYGADRIGPEWRSYSPLHNIGPAHPPTLFMLGDRDTLIPTETAERYCEAVRVSARCELIIYPEATHGWFNREGFVDTLRDSTRFIAEMFSLDPVTFADLDRGAASSRVEDEAVEPEDPGTAAVSDHNASSEPISDDE
jgi:acetyl esterase/lipase